MNVVRDTSTLSLLIMLTRVLADVRMSQGAGACAWAHAHVQVRMTHISSIMSEFESRFRAPNTSRSFGGRHVAYFHL
eukprot:4840949-Pleurochrysis_carterae.AAC.3